MKRKTAKEIFAESFREIAERKSADKITVKDIAENCGYSILLFLFVKKSVLDYNHAHPLFPIPEAKPASDKMIRTIAGIGSSEEIGEIRHA